MMPWKTILSILWMPVLGIFVAWFYQSDLPEWSKTLLKDLVHLSFNLKQSLSYDSYYVMFVLQWPTSVCIFEVIEKRRGRGYSATPQADCRFPSQQYSWTIHGIWNSRSSGSRCSSKPLRRSDVENITVELNERWVQVRKYFDNFNFWEYEWNKHGTCLLEHPNLNDPNKYFQQAINWHRQYDPTRALVACNILPDDTKKYNNIQTTNCLKEHLRITSRIILSTRNDYTYRDGMPLLREIRICFDRDFKLANCESSDPFSFDFIYPRSVENKSKIHFQTFLGGL